ncbi:hypothetical protein FBQ95_17210 [Chloroflexi bacterium CFX3]|nr:hypothetical protein [Chloroflexi bacterium CFX3]
MAGRKPKLTLQLIADLEVVLQTGTSVRDACAYVGISEQSFFYWLKQGKRLLENGYKPKLNGASGRNAMFLTFAERVERARAVPRVEAIALIRKAFQDDWRAALAFLERSDPENWGRRVVTAQIGRLPNPSETPTAERKPPTPDTQIDSLAHVLRTLVNVGALMLNEDDNV